MGIVVKPKPTEAILATEPERSVNVLYRSGIKPYPGELRSWLAVSQKNLNPSSNSLVITELTSVKTFVRYSLVLTEGNSASFLQPIITKLMMIKKDKDNIFLINLNFFIIIHR